MNTLLLKTVARLSLVASVAACVSACTEDATQASEDTAVASDDLIGINNAITITPVGGAGQIYVSGYNFARNGDVYVQVGIDSDAGAPRVVTYTWTLSDAQGRIAVTLPVDAGAYRVTAYDREKGHWATVGTVNLVYVSPAPR